MPQIIDLDEYRSNDSKVFAGRERGKLARQRADLDQIDHTDTTVLVRVPEDIYSINSSFFLGMFGPSIRRFGGEEFRRRFSFEGKDIRRVIEDGIKEALRTKSPL